MNIQIGLGNGYTTGINCNLIEYEGLESPSPDAFIKERVLRDGAVWNGGRIASRRITLTVDFGFVGYEAVLNSFRSLVGYNLTVTRDDVTSYIQGYIDSAIERVSDGGVNDPLVLQISYLCPNPYFTRTEISQSVGASDTDGLEYPAEYPIQFESFVGGTSIWLPNESPTPAPLLITCKAVTSLTDLNFRLGSITQTIGALDAGEVLVLDSDLMTATIDGSNAFSQVSWDFLEVPAGGGWLYIYEDDTLTAATITNVTYTPRWERV